MKLLMMLILFTGFLIISCKKQSQIPKGHHMDSMATI